MACAQCEPFGGEGWIVGERGARPCRCRAVTRQSGPPVLDERQATILAEMLGAVPGFPGDAGARSVISDELRAICHCWSDGLDLVRSMADLYERWPGPRELRRVYHSRIADPLDGVLPEGISEVYPDGIPSRRKRLAQLERPTAGRPKHEVITDPKIEQAVTRAAAKLPRMPAAGPVNSQFARQLKDLETAPQDRPELPGPAPQVITQADIDEAVRKHREQMALQEQGASD